MVQRSQSTMANIYIYGIKFTNNGRHGCRCELPNYSLRGKALRARENSFALTASNLWNSLPRCLRDLSGKDLPHFKTKLDKVLTYYPDIPRCSTSGHAYDMYGRKSNSICDHYNNRRAKQILNNLNDILRNLFCVVKSCHVRRDN